MNNTVNSTDDLSSNIRVYCRVRGGGNTRKPITEVSPDTKTISVAGKHSFAFSWVGDGNVSQEDVFNSTGKPLAASFLKGYYCCLFAFGQVCRFINFFFVYFFSCYIL